jgi:hypothetical protein
MVAGWLAGCLSIGPRTSASLAAMAGWRSSLSKPPTRRCALLALTKCTGRTERTTLPVDLPSACLQRLLCRQAEQYQHRHKAQAFQTWHSLEGLSMHSGTKWHSVESINAHRHKVRLLTVGRCWSTLTMPTAGSQQADCRSRTCSERSSA